MRRPAPFGHLAGGGGARQASQVTVSGDHAEVSTLLSQVGELVARVVAVADHYRDTADSAIAVDLDTAEQALRGAARVLERALGALGERAGG